VKELRCEFTRRWRAAAICLAGGPPIDFRSLEKRAVSSAVEHCFHTAGATGSIPVPPTNQRTSRRLFDPESYLPDHVDRLMAVSAPDAVCAEVRFIKSKDLASLQGFSGRDHRGVR
jgi:hypothetical protein